MSTYIAKLIQQLKKEQDSVNQFQLISELLNEGFRPIEIARRSDQKDYTVRHHAQ
jgi:hypothetical protein